MKKKHRKERRWRDESYVFEYDYDQRTERGIHAAATIGAVALTPVILLLKLLDVKAD